MVRSIRQYLYYYDNLATFRALNNTEVLVIERLKYMYRNYHEKDESFVYNSVLVTIEIDGLRADIYLECEDIYRERVFYYDPESDTVEHYY